VFVDGLETWGEGCSSSSTIVMVYSVSFVCVQGCLYPVPSVYVPALSFWSQSKFCIQSLSRNSSIPVQSNVSSKVALYSPQLIAARGKKSDPLYRAAMSEFLLQDFPSRAKFVKCSDTARSESSERSKSRVQRLWRVYNEWNTQCPSKCSNKEGKGRVISQKQKSRTQSTGKSTIPRRLPEMWV
jgi:hypothetical protein